LSVFPLALLALFIAGRVLGEPEFEQSVLVDLRQLFPTATDDTLTSALERIRGSSTSFGVFALLSTIYVSSMFWGALDTAFCRIYDLPCRSWLRQKRFALGMLVFVLLFMAATVLVPTVQSLLISGAEDLPFGLARIPQVLYAGTLIAGLTLLFGILCIVYWAVPNQRMPWRAVWPGALAATIAVGVVDYAFPAYLTSVSTIARFGTTFVFVLIVLLWFYAIALILLLGAEINAHRANPPAA
ncbi:MAG: YihY/virulence factor BrkB family protein, partial [Actinomycetota bacterium]|nr:YihY/virulence factor BrkB family protein [Actinomycetota bacterium]